jgi:hypothetical protein
MIKISNSKFTNNFSNLQGSDIYAIFSSIAIEFENVNIQPLSSYSSIYLDTSSLKATNLEIYSSQRLSY